MQRAAAARTMAQENAPHGGLQQEMPYGEGNAMGPTDTSHRNRQGSSSSSG